MYRALLFLLMFFAVNASCQLYGQEADDLQCKVVELQTKTPISYATIQFKTKGNGVISNFDGDFRIPLRFKTDNETLIISCIGYETKHVALATLNNTVVNTIYLKPKIEVLNTVVIGAKTGDQARKDGLFAQSIVRKAIQNIPVNYPRQPFSSIGYFRDYQLVDNQFYNLNEGILEMFDSGFGTNKLLYNTNKEVLYAYKANTKFARDTVMAKAYDGKSKSIRNATLSKEFNNELSVLNIHDPIRNYDKLSFSFIYRFKDHFIQNHYFTKGRLLYLEDKPIYEIKFYVNAKVRGPKHTGSGIIYISKDNFAIHKLTYEVNDIYHDSPLFNLTVEYKPLNGKMYLNYITFNNRFLLNDRNGLKILETSFDAGENAFFIKFNHDIDESTISRKLNYRLRYKKNKLLVDKVSLEDKSTIKVKVKNWTIPESFKSGKADMTDFTYKVKNVTDITGRKLNRSNKFVVNQYREFFVQDVFIGKFLNQYMKFINNHDFMRFSEINESDSYSNYWINTPLIPKESKK